jgi:hypothetical protein
MADFLDNQDEQGDPPLPSGYVAVKKQSQGAPPLPSGYVLKKKGSSEPTSQKGAVVSPTKPIQQSTSSDTEPPKRAQASVALGGTTNFVKEISSIDKNLISKEEEEVVPLLNKKFSNYGFTFEETGVGDAMIVKNKKGETIEIDLDPFTTTGEEEGSIKLKRFLSQSKQQQVFQEAKDLFLKPKRSLVEDKKLKQLTDEKRILDPDTSLYDDFLNSQKNTDEERQEAEKIVTDKFNLNGAWNITKAVLETSWNLAVPKFLETEGIASTEYDKKANDEFNQYVNYLKIQKQKNPSIEIPKYDPAQIKQRAFEIAVDEELSAKRQTRTNKFMEAVENLGLKDSLLAYDTMNYQTISDQDKQLLEEKSVNELALEESNKRIVGLSKQINDLGAKGLNPTPELLNTIKQETEANNEISKAYFKSQEDYYNKNKELGSFEENLDILNRDYGFWQNSYAAVAQVGGHSLRGLLGLAGYVTRNDPYFKGLSSKSREASKNISKKMEEIGASVAKPIEAENISDIRDFSRWLTNSVVIPTTSFVGQVAAGPVGMSSLVGQSVGNKYNDMKDMNDAGQANFNEAQMIGVPLATGSVDAALFIFTGGMLRGAQRVIRSATQAEKNIIGESVFKDLVNKQLHGLAVMEGITISKNAIDKFSGVDPNRGLLDGTKESAAVSIATVGMLNTAPQLVAKINYQFSLDKKAFDASETVNRLETSLKNTSLSEENRSIISDQLTKAKEDLNDILKKQTKNISSLSNEQYQEVIKLNNERVKISEKAKKIREDQSLDKNTKTQLFEGLKKELSAVEARRRLILENGPTIEIERLNPELAKSLREQATKEIQEENKKQNKINETIPQAEIDKRAMSIHNEKTYATKTIDNLPLNEQDRLKRDALTQLTKELNPEGKEDIVIDNEQITQRAFEIHSKELESMSVKPTEVTPTEENQYAKSGFYFSKDNAEGMPEAVSIQEQKDHDTIIQKIVDKGVENNDSAEKIRDKVYKYLRNNGVLLGAFEINGIKEYVNGKVEGTLKTDFVDYRRPPSKPKPTEAKAAEVKPAIESPIELKEGEELVDVKQDKKGNTYTYVAETSEKDGVKTTKFKFNRSDKSSEQRNSAGVDADKVLDKYGYEIPADQIQEGAEIIEINEIREGEKTTGATVTFKNTETGNTFQGEIVLEPKAKEAKAEEVNPAEVKEPAIVVHATVDQKGFALSHSEGIAKENILEPSDTRDFTRTATPEQKTEYNKGMAVIQTDEALDNGDKKISIVKSMVDPAGREGGATFDFIIPKGNNTTAENIKQVINDVSSNRDLKGKKLIDETVKQVKNYIDSNKPTEAKAEVKPAEALKDVESTKKALLNDIVRKEGFDGSENQKKFFKASRLVPEEIWAEIPKAPSDVIAEAYHKAKADGSNPELVKAVEELLAPEVAPEVKTPEATANEVKTVTHNGIEYTKNDAGNWVNTKTGNEIKGIGEKGKDLIKTLNDLSKPAEDQKSTYLEEQKFFQETSPFAWAVDEVTPETLDKSTIVENEGTYGVVTPDGDIKGVFNPNVAKVREGREAKKGTIRTLIEKALAAGGIKLDNFDGRLTKIYSDNGFREVSRVPFNEKYAREGWNKEQHGTPDVVAMVYDPQGKLKIEKKSFTDYDEAMKYRDSYIEEAKKLQEVKPAEVKPTIKNKLEAFKAKYIDRPVFDRAKLNTQVENAKKSISKILPNVKFVIHDTRESFIKEAGKNAPGYYDTKTSTIHINALEANSRTVYHEVFHPLLIERLKTDSNVRELTKKMLGALSRTMDANPELKKTLDDFITRYDENLRSEEKVTELFGHLADGYEGFDAPTKSLVKRFIDRVAVILGLDPFTEGDVVGMLKTLAGKVSTGEEIISKDVKIIKEQKIIKDAVSKFQSNFIDPKSKIEFIYDKNKDKFKKLELEGYITKDKSIEDFDGQTIFLHQPDAAFSGEIYKNGEPLVEGKGGVYYPIKFHEDGYFWASTESTANKMAKDLNAAREANGGKLLMALTSAPSDKLLSSTTAANGVMDIILSKAFDKNFSLNKEQAKTSLIDAANKVVVIEGKKIGLGLKLKKGSTLEEVKSEIQNKLNPDNSSFADRKAFVKSLISNVADIVKQNPKAVDQFGKFFSEGIKNESFKGVTKTGKLSISAANMTQGISEMLTEPMLKEGVDRNKGGQVYAILELNGEVKPVKSDKHESYPKAIQSVDPNNKVKLHILTDRVKWSDVFEDPTTKDIVSKERELKIFPTSGVSTEGLKLNTKKGKFQEPESYSDMKDIVKDMMDDGKSIEEIKNVIGTELGKDQISLAEKAYNEFKIEPIPTEAPKTTSIKNAVVAAEREAKGKEPIEQREKYSSKVNYEETKAKVDSGEILPRDLASSIVNNPKEVAITSEVSDALAYDRMRLSNEYNKVLKDIVENPNDPTNIIARDRLEKQMEENDKASRYSGTISSHALLARKNVIKQDYSLDRLILRYKAATGGKISDQMRAKFETMSTKLEEANAKLEQYESKESERLAAKALVEIKKEVRQQKRTESKENLKKEREDLYTKLREIRKEQMSRLSANPLPVEMVPIISKLAKNLIMDGVVTLDGVVDEIHTNLKGIFDDIQKRDIRDALSGYGNFKLPSKDEIDVQLREIKSQARLISAYEDAEAGKAPLKTGFQREAPSDRVRELQRQVQEMMKQNGITRESLSAESTWKTALDGIKTRLKNQIRDLEKQIATGEKTPKKQGVAYDAEAIALKEQRDSLKKIIEDTEGKREITDEQRVKIAVSAVEKSIAEYERRISERDIAPKEKGVKTPETPELKTLKDIRENLKKEYDQMKEEIDPKKTPEERALASIKTRLNNRAAELQNMLDSGNFEKKKRTPTPLDKEAMELKANVERIKNKVDVEIKKEEQKNRTKYEKTLDFISGWRRTMLLTGVKVLGKLQTAAMTRSTISPIEEIIGGVLSKIPGISKISEKAPRQGGGFVAKAELKAISQWWQKATYQDMVEIAKSGKGMLDLLHGKKDDLPPSVLDIFGQLHQALKQPAKRNEYFRSFEKRLAHANRNGIDVTDPMVQLTIGTEAYLDANRAIFMQENIVTQGYKSFLASLERGGNVGKTGAAFAKIILPIVKVPTNYVGEVTSYSGGYAKALPLITKAIFKGVDSLTPEQSDYVMRNLKKGSLGAAFIALGYFNSEDIGGYYQRGEKRKEEDVDAGGLRLFGEDMPKWLVHTPLLECLQIGATLKRVQDSYDKKGKEEEAKLAAGLAVAKGLVEEVPFARSPEEALRALGSTKQFKTYTRDLLESMINPQLTKELFDLEILPKIEGKEGKISMEELKVKSPAMYKIIMKLKEGAK